MKELDQRAYLFDVQRGSFVDGPGIRTTVFFKGCNLNCAWCHNPESKSPALQMLFYRSRCVECGRCRSVCKNGAVGEDFEVDPDKCVLCGECCLVCHTEAKALCGYPLETEKILAKLRKDARFFEESQGGVTFSGGECMLQQTALLALLKGCREGGIHTAVDTAGNVPWQYFEEVLPYTCLFLYDLKHTSETRHRQGTGVSNRLILENLAHLLDLCPDKVWVRIPVIPGFNDDAESLTDMGRWLGAHPRPVSVEPLAYHSLGEHKSEAMGLSPFTAKVPSKEEFEEKKQILFHAMEEQTAACFCRANAAEGRSE